MKTIKFILQALIVLIISITCVSKAEERKKNKVSAAYRVGFNFDAAFKSANTRSSLLPPIPYEGSSQYLDGYVEDDSRYLQNRTANWGYYDVEQDEGGDVMAFHNIDYITSSKGNADADPMHGIEVGYWRELGAGKRTAWGVVGKIGFSPFGVEGETRENGTASLITDRYWLVNYPPPSAPYEGPFDGGGPEIFTDMIKRSQCEVPLSTRSSHEIEGGLITYTFGPYAEIALAKRVTLSLDGGLALGTLHSDYRVKTTSSAAGWYFQNDENKSSWNGAVGFYAGGAVNVALGKSRLTSLFAGASYMNLDTVTEKVAGNSAKMDLSKILWFTVGLARKF